MSNLTNIFEESFYDGDDFKGRTGKNVRHVREKIIRPFPSHVNFKALTSEHGHISKRRSPLLVGRDGSLMAPPTTFDEQSAPNSYDGVRNSEFSDFGGRLDYSESIESSAYDELTNPMNYCDSEPDNFFFGLIGNKKKIAEKRVARAEKALSKGKTKKAGRMLARANKTLNKINAGNAALNTTQTLQGKIEQDTATANANNAALDQIRGLAGSGGTASDNLRSIQESLATAPGQISPSQNAAYPAANTDMSPLQAGGGGGGGSLASQDAENGGAVKELSGVTVTNDKLGSNKWLLIGGGILAVIVVIYFIVKKKK